MIDWEVAKAELRQPLNPGAIRQPAPGKYGEYVDGLHVIREANRIFGEFEWSYEITAMQQVCRVETKDRNGNDQVRVGYRCQVRAQVGDTFREGAAVGSGIAKPENEADAHESAVKEAETDALKRALRCFGNTFGLALYEKDKSAREVGIPFDPAAARDRIKAKLEKAPTLEVLGENWKSEQAVIAEIKASSEPMFNELNKAKNDRKATLGAQLTNQGAG